MTNRVLTVFGTCLASLASLIVSVGTTGLIGEVKPPKSLLEKR